ncbi:MAG: hypothetical protein J6B07_05760 [Opitutales bacterium]|nr:hypothetical protein [Opitutales bacterium]
MFDFIKFKKKTKGIALFNCKTSEIKKIDSFPYFATADFSQCQQGHAVIEIFTQADGSFAIAPIEKNDVFVNSCPLTEAKTIENTTTLRIGENLYYLTTSAEIAERFRKIDVSRWLIFYADNGRIEDEVPFERIRNSVINRGLSGEGMAICPYNFEIGFMFLSVFNDGIDVPSSISSVAPVLAESAVAATCPLCWLKFDLGDAMSIATHESLRGDPILGADEMLRFLPTSFNEDGVALDATGMPSPDIACPHCRKRLPPNYLELDQKIFSIVGAPSSGKSYYLSVLIHQLSLSLYKNFGIVMKDLDPSGNMLLSQMKNRLFSATRPEDAILAKTALEGAMYERYPRFGKMVSLPKPMTYSLAEDGKPKTSMIFYDNAGEHFEPGLDIEQSPGAMHVASSAAIFFLFDPAANRDFKSALGDYPDPQLSIVGRVDQQDTILSEMEVRIKRIKALDLDRRIDTPLAIIIGKCDMWTHLLKEPLPEVIVDGKLDLSAVDRSSEILRSFLLNIAPNIVAAGDSISTNTKYFAVSALGHSPQMINEGFCAGKIAPIPGKLNPINTDIPIIWALSQCSELIPTK